MGAIDIAELLIEKGERAESTLLHMSGTVCVVVCVTLKFHPFSFTLAPFQFRPCNGGNQHPRATHVYNTCPPASPLPSPPHSQALTPKPARVTASLPAQWSHRTAPSAGRSCRRPMMRCAAGCQSWSRTSEHGSQSVAGVGRRILFCEVFGGIEISWILLVFENWPRDFDGRCLTGD